MPLLRPFLFLLPASPALLTSPDSFLQTGVQRSPRDASQPIKVQISEGCVQMGDSSDSSQSGGVKELDLEPGSPLILTHRIRLMPSSGSGSGSCGCEADFEALKARIERLEREVSELREKCGGPEGGCCTSQSSTGTEHHTPTVIHTSQSSTGTEHHTHTVIHTSQSSTGTGDNPQLFLDLTSPHTRPQVLQMLGCTREGGLMLWDRIFLSAVIILSLRSLQDCCQTKYDTLYELHHSMAMSESN